MDIPGYNKGHQPHTQTNIILSREKVKASTIKLGSRQRGQLAPHQSNIVFTVLTMAVSHLKELEGIQTKKTSKNLYF